MGMAEGLGGTRIKSMQNVVVTPGSVISNVTINAVNMASTMMIRTSWRPGPGSPDPENSCVLHELTSSTNIRTTRAATGSGGGDNPRCRLLVIEYNEGDLKSIQRGTKYGAGDVTINAVDLDKTIVTYLGQSGGWRDWRNGFGSSYILDLTSPTNLNVTTSRSVDYTGVLTATISYEIVEFRI